MRKDSPACLFFCVWLAVALSVMALMIISVWVAQNFLYKNIFMVSRLDRIHKAGIVVIGTSLSRYAFPYDSAMEEYGLQSGMNFQFVRFTLSSGEPNDFLPLLKPILIAQPKWVFIEVVPFVSKMSVLEKISNDSHMFLSFSLRYHFHKMPIFAQDDSILKNDTRATFVSHVDEPTFNQNPCLSLPYQQFLEQAQSDGIRVVFIQLPRSQLVKFKMGSVALTAENIAIARLAAKLHVSVWVSPTWPLAYYTDGTHLNAEGRLMFTKWFLTRLKHESMA